MQFRISSIILLTLWDITYIISVRYVISHIGECFMEKFIVEFFVDDKGNIPAKEFLLSLEPKLRAKVFRDIDLFHKKEMRHTKTKE